MGFLTGSVATGGTPATGGAPATGGIPATGVDGEKLAAAPP